VTLRYLGRAYVSQNIWTFHFQPSEPISWVAGQFMRIDLPHANPDAEGTSRFFTISSAPHERTIDITTRLTGTTFKQALAALRPGHEIHLIDPPAGDFVWPAMSDELLFVAQGVGITPFWSMLKDRTHRRADVRATLIYTSSSETSLPFIRELTTMATDHTNLRLYIAPVPATPASVADLLPHFQSTHIFVSGPKSLVGLLSAPYNLPTRQLKEDYFPGYISSDY
jgi:ferredoxin-NADP reductase